MSFWGNIHNSTRAPVPPAGGTDAGHARAGSAKGGDWRSFTKVVLGRRRALIIIGLIVLAGAIIGPVAHAGNVVVDLVGNTIFLLLNNIVMAMTRMFASLTGIFVSLLVVVARYNTFLNAPVVQSGWPIVRDLMNMVFIIALLIISAGTVLRLQNYRYNRLLGKLIIMAFLVNFSKFIAVFLLQFAQVVMITFVNAFREVAFGNFSHMFGLDAVINFSQTYDRSAGSNMGIFITLLAGLAMMIVAFVVMLAITIMLFVRIIALWLLIILSPIAYALRILPNTEKYASQWWSEFTKYAVLGPVLAFFLWISLALVQSSPSCPGAGDCGSNPLRFDTTVNTALTQATEDTKDLRSDFLTELLSIDRLMTFIVGIIFLLMGLQYAQKSGAVGASFAGRVATTGFGVGATLTGLNAIRDRTLAPVQGWFKNRAAARQSAIQQRTETLEAAGDRVAAGYGLTRGARERGAAAAAVYDTQRTARYAQQRGVKNMEEEHLMQGYLDKKADPRQRIAYMQELHARKRLNFSDPGQLGAFNALTGAIPGKRRGFTTGQTYIAPAEQRKMREEMLRANMDHMSADDVRNMAPELQSPEEQKLMLDALEKKDAVRADNPADVAMVNGLRANLRDLPAALKEFDDALKKSNPRMALQTVYNNFSAGTNDVNRLWSDANQGLFDTSNLRTRDYAAMVLGMRRTNGMNTNQAQEHISNTILSDARSKKELDGVVDAMQYDVQRMVFGGKPVNLPDVGGRRNERRDWLATKGYAGEAFQGLPNEDAVMRNFVRGNEALVARFAREGKISRQTVGQQTAMREMMDSLRIGRTVLNEMVTNNPELRDTARDTAVQVVYHTNVAVDAAGTPIAVADISEQGLRENTRREVALDMAQGGNVIHPMSGNDANVLDVITTGMPMAQQSNVRTLRQRAVRRQLGNWRRLNFESLDSTAANTMSSEARQDLVMESTVEQLNALAAIRPDMARTIAGVKYHNGTSFTQGDTVEGHALLADEAQRLTRTQRNLRTSDRGLI